jgi:hypothetical protein
VLTPPIEGAASRAGAKQNQDDKRAPPQPSAMGDRRKWRRRRRNRNGHEIPAQSDLALLGAELIRRPHWFHGRSHIISKMGRRAD